MNLKHDRLTLISALADYEISLTSSSTTERNPTRLIYRIENLGPSRDY